MINSNFLSVDLRANLRADVSCDGYSGEMLRSSGTILVSCSRAANVHLPHQEVKGCKRDPRGYDGGCATPFSQSGPYRAFIIASNAVVQLRENGHSSFAQHARLAEVRVADEV